MKSQSEAHRLRVYVNESDRWENRPVYELIIRAAKEQGLAGATALRGVEGYGVSGRVHSVKVLHLSEDVPIVIEIIDSPDRIAKFLPTLDELVSEGAVTVEAVHLITYRREDGATAEIQLEDEIQLDTGPEPPATVMTTSSTPATLEFTDRAHQIMTAARESATKSHRAYADSVDVLLAMLCETRGIAASALKALGVDCKVVERALRETVSRDEASTGYLRSLLMRSTAAAKWLDDDSTGAEHLLLAMCQIRPSAATDILTRLGAQPRDVCQEVLNAIGRDGDWQRWLADHPEL